MRCSHFARFRAPVTLLTFAAFWASLMAPMTAAAQTASDRAAASDLQVDGPAHTGGSAPEPPAEPAGEPASPEPTVQGSAAKAAHQAELEAAEPDLDADALKAAAEAAAKQEPLQTTALPSGDDKSGVTSKSISVPKGSGTVTGMGESFSAQLSTGIATYSVPFALPSARGGVQPALGLSYSSSGGHGNAGVGWNVGSAFIARQTDRGLPNYEDLSGWHANQDRFVFNGGQELVPVCDVGSGLSCAGAVAGEVMPSWSVGWQYHRPRVEGSFMRFFWSPDRRSWRVQSKSGQVLELGVPLDGSNYTGGLERNPSVPAEVFRWYVTREYDTYTDTGAADGKPLNVVLYRYQEDGGSKYLSDIYDTTPAEAPTDHSLARFAHHTRLVWEPRNDTSHSYRSGWRMEQNLRLAAVDVTSASYGNEGRALVRRYELKYEPGYHVSLLQSVQLRGRCKPSGGVSQTVAEDATGALPAPLGCQTDDLPPMRFGYSHVGPPTSDGFEPFSEEVRSLSGSPPHSLDEALSDLFDVNSDGLPDVVVTAPGMYGGGYGWFENGGEGALEEFSGVQPIRLRGVLGANASTLQLSNLNLVPLDLDGDGHINLLHMPRVKTYAVYDFVRAGADYELQGRVVNTASGQDPKLDFGRDTTDTQVMDVNFDGLVDVVVTTGTQVETFFSLGRLPGGDGQFGKGHYTSASAASLSTEPEASCVPHSGLPVRFSDAETKVADINGDGIPDIVRIRSGDVRYWPGRGNGYWGTGERDDCPAGTFGAGRHVVMQSPPNYFGDALRLDDVNGDGLPDLVNIRFDEVDVWLNVNGERFTQRKIIDNTPPTPSYQSRVRLVDVDGSGTRDILWGNASNYRYIDLQGGTRPWILTEVHNGLGKTTSLEYTSSADEMLAAEAAGQPWDSKVPMVLHLVKRMTETDNLNVYGNGARSYTTEYTYRDPVYDGRQREFRGFREATSKSLGDANSPTSFARSEFLLGECIYTDGSACPASDQSFDNPHEGLKGLPIVSETYDEQGVYLSTSHTHYTLRQLYTGLDGRGVSYAFASGSTVFSYDTANPSAFASGTELVLDTVTAEGVGVGPSLESPVRLRATSGTVRTEGSSETDDFGNATRSVSRGCVSGCPAGADDVLEQHSEPVLLPHSSGWLWRTARSYTTSANWPAPRGDTSTTYTPEGNPDTVTAVLTGTEALQRSHAASGAIAPPPVDAVSDTAALLVSRTDYDEFGSAIRSHAPGNRCADVFLDPLYAQLATTEMMYPGGCPTQRSLTSPPAGTLYSAASYDRGLELVTHVVDVTFQITQVAYDGLGRLTELFRSEPGSATVGTLPAVAIAYDLATPSRPYSIVHTQSQDGAQTTSSAYMHAYSYVDGMGRSLVGITEADPTALDQGNYIISELLDYDAKGGVARKCLPRFSNASPLQFDLTAPLTGECGRVEHDAFGRDVRLYDLDGTQTLLNVYHALSSDAWDAADWETSSPHYGTYATSVSDGHGRAALSIERFKEGGSLIQRETRTQFLSTGEPLSITRSSVHGSTTRWLRYDSLGRMVLNVEPHTSTPFDPNPFADASNIRAWRYAYNPAGELVGTSDARGCGVNFAYDGVGRLAYEDYSPCEAEHQAYSAPSFGGPAPSGVEVYYHYDSAPPAALGTPSVPNGSGMSYSFMPGGGGEFLRGKLVAVFDRAKASFTNYDGRSRPWESWVRLAGPGTPMDSLADRYGGRWYRKSVQFDAADRVVRETTGAQSPELMGAGGQSFVEIAYSERGTVKHVGGSYGDLITDIQRTADGLHQRITYGDLAATTTAFAYDQRRRLSSVQTYRGPPSAWSNPSGAYTVPSDPSQTTFQLLLQDDHFVYDIVGNPLRIEDLRNPDEWPAGAKPVTREMRYDDLYRVTRVEYGYSHADAAISKPNPTPAPSGVGPAGFHTRITPSLAAQQVAAVQARAKHRPEVVAQPAAAAPAKPKRPDVVAQGASLQIEPLGPPGPVSEAFSAALPRDYSELQPAPGLPALPAPQEPAEPAPLSPVAITGQAPSGVLSAPYEFDWNGVTDATGYLFVLHDGGGYIHERTLTPTELGCVGGGACSIDLANVSPAVTLADGAARWNVQIQGGAEDGDWGSWIQVSVGTVPSLGAASLTLPHPVTGLPFRTSWVGSAGASHYEFEILRASDSALVFGETRRSYEVCTGTACSLSFPTFDPGDFTVRIRSNSEHNLAGPWSNTIAFTVDAAGPTPTAPAGLTPNTAAYSYTSRPGVIQYQIRWVSHTGAFHTVYHSPSQIGCTSDVCTFNWTRTLPDGAAVWGVSGGFGGGVWTPWKWNDIAYGGTEPTLAAPTQLSPSGLIGFSAKLRWTAQFGAVGYEAELLDSGGTPIEVYSRTKAELGCAGEAPAACTVVLPTLAAGDYRWRVRAVGLSPTNLSPWTSELPFTVDAYAPSPITPAGTTGAGPVGTLDTYRWTAPANAQYRVLVYTSFGGTPTEVTPVPLWAHCLGEAVCDYPIARPIASGPAVWGVQRHMGIPGVWSPFRWQDIAFGDTLPTLAAPIQYEPAGLVGAPVTPTWKPDMGVGRYDLELFDGSGATLSFNQYTKAELGCAAPTSAAVVCKAPSIALGLGTYSWRVRARGLDDAPAPWSDELEFSIDETGPTPVSPSGELAGQPTIFRWTPRVGVSQYHLRVWDSSGGVQQFYVLPHNAGCAGNAGICTAVPWYQIPAGAAYWEVRGSYGVGSHTGWRRADFSIGPIQPFIEPVQVAPSGLVGAPFNLEWEHDPAAARYDVTLHNAANQQIFSAEYTRTALGCGVLGQNCISPNLSQSAGTYTWRVRSKNAQGAIGPWSSGMAFEVDAAAPTPLTPNTDISQASPTYTFTALSGATEYYWSIADASGNYEMPRSVSLAEAACSGGICNYTPAFQLAPGAAYWGIRGRRADTTWTAWQYQAFSYQGVPPLGVPVQLTPNGTAQSPVAPTWEADPAASQYDLWVLDANQAQAHFSRTSKANAGCSAGTGICTGPSITLAPGNHTWVIASVNPHERGPLSGAMAFTVTNLPVAPTVLAPIGVVRDTIPTYSWTSQPSVTEYELRVDSAAAGQVLQQRFTPTETACAGAVNDCILTPAVVLRPGSHTVWVRAVNSYGEGPWSTPEVFNILEPLVGQDDEWEDPNAGLADPRRAEPTPYQEFDERIRYQSWDYDWLGNTAETDDDAKGFYDRSLGEIENGPLAGKAYQLNAADNRASQSPRQGALRTTYDVTGNLTELRLDRDGTCIPTGRCSQIFRYNWDEVGRLVTAKRWDHSSLLVSDTTPPSGIPDVELHYAYDAGDMRVSKRAVDTEGEESWTLYLFNTLELRRTTFVSAEGDFALNPLTEVAYLFANGTRLARLAYEAPGDVPSMGGETLHVFFELGDHLGSTSVVLDKATGELVERSTYQAYGGTESDYRPERWKSFREDYRFTGKEEDVEVGLIYFGKRFLNPLLNRWVSADPLAVHALGADPNLYAYVSGRVLQSVDPLGLEGTDRPSDAQVQKEMGISKEDWESATPDRREEAVAGFMRKTEQWRRAQQTMRDMQATLAAEAAGAIKGSAEAVADFQAGSAAIMVPGAAGTAAAELGQAFAKDPIGTLYGIAFPGQKLVDDTAKGVANAEQPGDAGQAVGYGATTGAIMVATEVAGGAAGAGAGAAGTAGAGQARGAFAKIVQFLKRGCFVAGTPVHGSAGLVPIEAVALGDRVGPPSEECASLPLDGWVEIHARMYAASEDGAADEVDITLLRPEAWVSAVRLMPGGFTYLELEELQLAGPAYITDVKAARALPPGERCPVTGTLRRLSSDVIRLDLATSAIEVTAGHPLYSADRVAWVPAGALTPGEQLRGLTATVTVRGVDTSPRPATEVFNLEVWGEHYYFVGDAGVWAHNICSDPPPAAGAGGRARFAVTESGVSIPTNPAELRANLSLLSEASTNPATSRKFVGRDSQGPIRVRVEQGHADDPNFHGPPDPLHTVDHLHLDRRANGETGSWGSKEKAPYDWPF